MTRSFGVGWFGVGLRGLVPMREADQATGFIMGKNQSMRVLVRHIVWQERKKPKWG